MPRPKGLPKTGGRKRGVQNKITRELREVILGALDAAGGEKYLAGVAKDRPEVFCRLLGLLLPTRVEAGDDDIVIVNPRRPSDWDSD